MAQEQPKLPLLTSNGRRVYGDPTVKSRSGSLQYIVQQLRPNILTNTVKGYREQDEICDYPSDACSCTVHPNLVMTEQWATLQGSHSALSTYKRALEDTNRQLDVSPLMLGGFREEAETAKTTLQTRIDELEERIAKQTASFVETES